MCVCLSPKLRHHQRHNSLSYLRYILYDLLILMNILFINDISIKV